MRSYIVFIDRDADEKGISATALHQNGKTTSYNVNSAELTKKFPDTAVQTWIMN